MRIRSLAAATALAAASALSLTTGASAVPGSGAQVTPRSQTCLEITGATACFESDGDHIYASDTEADGYHVEVPWRTDYGRTGLCVFTGGSGETGDCNYDMAEGSKVEFSVELWNEDTYIGGDGPRTATI